MLVTGGAGYIGSQVCKSLARAGFVPVTFDSLETGHRDAVRWGPMEVGDVRDRARLMDVMSRHVPVAVMHFAAYIAVGESVANPVKYYDNNVGGALALLHAMRERGVTCVVLSSSAAVYGAPQHIPIPETHPIQPTNPYGASKAMVEQMLQDSSAASGLRAVALRYFNAAGADPDGELGEAHDPETHLVPIILDAALGRSSGVSIFGDSYPTPDGTCVRDYVHVADLATAHVLALQYLLKGAAGFSAFNLGNNRGYSVREVLDLARQVTGREISVSLVPPRPGDEAVLVSDSSRARGTLGWQPAYAELEIQLVHAWRWHRQRFGGA